MCVFPDYKERFTIYFEMKDGLYTAGPYFWAKVSGSYSFATHSIKAKHIAVDNSWMSKANHSFATWIFEMGKPVCIYVAKIIK